MTNAPETGEKRRRNLRAYPVQLTQVFCADVRVQRKPKRTKRSAGPRLDVTLSSTDFEQDQTAFSCRLTVVVGADVLEGEAVEIRLIVQGDFNWPAELDSDEYARFVEYTPLVQLWPYARAYVDIGASLAGIDLPVLPLIDALRPGDVEESAMSKK